MWVQEVAVVVLQATAEHIMVPVVAVVMPVETKLGNLEVTASLLGSLYSRLWVEAEELVAEEPTVLGMEIITPTVALAAMV